MDRREWMIVEILRMLREAEDGLVEFVYYLLVQYPRK